MRTIKRLFELTFWEIPIIYLFSKPVNDVYQSKRISVVTTDSMLFPDTDNAINNSNISSRRGSDPAKQNRYSEIVAPEFAVPRGMSLNGVTEDLLIDEDYIGYHRDRPAPEQLAERRLKMESDNSVLTIIHSSEKITDSRRPTISPHQSI